MRGWKPISFEQFSEHCSYRGSGSCSLKRRCGDEYIDEYPCCQSLCRTWKKAGRKDLKVAKKEQT